MRDTLSRQNLDTTSPSVLGPIDTPLSPLAHPVKGLFAETIPAAGNRIERWRVAKILTREGETLCYVMEMTQASPHEATTVEGLVDNRGAAALLGIDVSTFKVWGSRARSGKHGIPSLMPAPVGTLHGNVYRAVDILHFKALLNEQPPTKRLTLPPLSLTEKRSLGSYFTPNDAVHLMVAWALRGDHETVLEPSLGDGTFLSAIKVYAEKRGWRQPLCVASELDPGTASAAVTAGAIDERNLLIGDFLTHKHDPVDVVIGNPPYVRIRALDKAAASVAMQASQRTIGLPMDPAGSVWMPFVSKSTTHLKEGGRLAFVLPLDLTYVKYARPLWNFLSDNFGTLTVLRFRQRVFPDILQNVLILLADKKGEKTNHVSFAALDAVADFDINRLEEYSKIKINEILEGGRPFQSALLPQATRSVYDLLLPHSTPARARAKFNIGYVSGNKRYFHPDPESVKQFNLPQRNLIPTAVSTRQLSGQGLRTSSMDVSQYLWRPSKVLSAGEKQYIQHGEAELVDEAYKCRIRSPWYTVPGVKKPDLLMSVFSDQPRLHLNDADWTASNSVLCGYLEKGHEPRPFVSSWYSALTLLSSELEVHALGGGVMIAVPREADAIRMLSEDSTSTVDEAELNRALSGNKVIDAYAVGNKNLDALVGKHGRQLIWEGIETLSKWRKSAV